MLVAPRPVVTTVVTPLAVAPCAVVPRPVATPRAAAAVATPPAAAAVATPPAAAAPAEAPAPCLLSSWCLLLQRGVPAWDCATKGET